MRARYRTFPRLCPYEFTTINVVASASDRSSPSTDGLPVATLRGARGEHFDHRVTADLCERRGHSDIPNVFDRGRFILCRLDKYGVMSSKEDKSPTGEPQSLVWVDLQKLDATRLRSSLPDFAEP